MSHISVLVAATSPDIQAGVIAEAISKRPDMSLVELGVAEVGGALAAIPPRALCALILVGPAEETDAPAAYWLAQRATLVVLRVNVPDDFVQIALRDIGLDALISMLRSLVERAGARPAERTAHIQLHAAASRRPAIDASAPKPSSAPRRPLLDAATRWIHATLRAAAERHGSGNGITVAIGNVQQALAEREPGRVPAQTPGTQKQSAETALSDALRAAEAHSDPLAVAASRFGLSDLEWRLTLLALAAEIDPLYQTCFGLLLDDASRRVGTLALYSALLGEAPQVRRALAASGNLARWRILDAGSVGLLAGDEPLRLDPFLVRWLLGEPGALAHDARVRRALRPTPWPGAALLELAQDRERAARLVAEVQEAGPARCSIFAGDDAAGWRALFEAGAQARRSSLVRVEALRLAALDAAEIDEIGLRLGRLALLCGRPLIVDASVAVEDDVLRQLFAAIGAAGVRSAIICGDAARVVRLLGATPFTLTEDAALHAASRAAVVRAAAHALEVPLGDDAARAMAQQYPLAPDGIEHAMRLASAARVPGESAEQRFAHLVEACKDVAAEGVTQFADRIDPTFELDDVVLPADQKRQLREIVDSVRFASKVLDEWQFRERLPYGRGTTALFHGPSGCGKTMSALAVAKALGVGHGRKSGVPVLRVELSRLVSKFIGDTPKHIDRVFEDARRSGAAVLVDEADALLQRRATGSGLDSNDRHSAMEVAYLLQKIENLHDEGLVILTTNLRQNMDQALLRRLRFVIEFPRPDAAAREEIWRRCLPGGSHALDDAAFRMLARKIDLAGGNIRQITLRAAFVAAAAGEQIGIEHLLYASRAELAKFGLPAAGLDSPELKAA